MVDVVGVGGCGVAVLFLFGGRGVDVIDVGCVALLLLFNCCCCCSAAVVAVLAMLCYGCLGRGGWM